MRKDHALFTRENWHPEKSGRNRNRNGWEIRFPARNFEIIVGRSLPEDRAACYLGLVHGYDGKPKRRLVEVLRAQGLQANQEITFIADGGEEVRTLVDRISPEAEHVLDWFHITMRIKWLAWHGNIHRLRDKASALVEDVVALELPYPNLKKFGAAAGDFYVYIDRNRASLINYGERYRAGERISSAFVEATVNAVVSKRFAKKQQLQWTPRGAHLLLQARTRALDGTLRSVFERWHPGLANDNFADPEHVAA